MNLKTCIQIILLGFIYSVIPISHLSWADDAQVKQQTDGKVHSLSFYELEKAGIYSAQIFRDEAKNLISKLRSYNGDIFLSLEDCIKAEAFGIPIIMINQKDFLKDDRDFFIDFTYRNRHKVAQKCNIPKGSNLFIKIFDDMPDRAIKERMIQSLMEDLTLKSSDEGDAAFTEERQIALNLQRMMIEEGDLSQAKDFADKTLLKYIEGSGSAGSWKSSKLFEIMQETIDWLSDKNLNRDTLPAIGIGDYSDKKHTKNVPLRVVFLKTRYTGKAESEITDLKKRTGEIILATNSILSRLSKGKFSVKLEDIIFADFQDSILYYGDEFKRFAWSALRTIDGSQEWIGSSFTAFVLSYDQEYFTKGRPFYSGFGVMFFNEKGWNDPVTVAHEITHGLGGIHESILKNILKVPIKKLMVQSNSPTIYSLMESRPNNYDPDYIDLSIFNRQILGWE